MYSKQLHPSLHTAISIPWLAIIGALTAIRLVGAEPLNLANMSARLSIEPALPMIVGFVVSNSSGGADGAVTRLLVRAAGPSLRQFGVSGADGLSLSVNGGSSTRVVARWSIDPFTVGNAANSVGAFPFSSPVGDDALIVETSAAALTISMIDGRIAQDREYYSKRVGDTRYPPVKTEQAQARACLAWLNGSLGPYLAEFRSLGASH